MLTPSEEVTKTWIKKKGILVKSRPKPSRFSFTVCIAIVISIAGGFLGGFVTAGFALAENYSSVYEGLLTELQTARSCLEGERRKLVNRNDSGAIAPSPQVNHASTVNQPFSLSNNQVRNNAIFSVFGHAVELLQKNDKVGGCAELKNIINLTGYNGKWRTKAQYLLEKNCLTK